MCFQVNDTALCPTISLSHRRRCQPAVAVPMVDRWMDSTATASLWESGGGGSGDGLGGNLIIINFAKPQYYRTLEFLASMTQFSGSRRRRRRWDHIVKLISTRLNKQVDSSISLINKHSCLLNPSLSCWLNSIVFHCKMCPIYIEFLKH